MNRNDVMLAVIEMGRSTKAVAPEDAISLVAQFIDRLETADPNYERDVAALMTVGACIWQLQRELLN